MFQAEPPPVLSSVVVLRLRDFARRPVAEQARLTAQLDTVLALLAPDIAPRERIVLDGHGSVAVAVLGNPPAALSLARRALRANQTGLGLCIGIDHGPVQIMAGDAGDALAGDGVATAVVMASFASDAGLLVSKNFRAALAQTLPGAQGVLVASGSFNDAGLRSYQAFGMDTEAPLRRRRRFIMIAAAAVLVLFAAAAALRLGVPDRPRPLAPYADSALAPVLDRLQRITRGQP
jgi:hypothetical protein